METFTATHKHKHYDIFAQFISYCNNGSLKVWKVDNTRPLKSQRKPKMYTISKFELDQWQAITK